MAVDLSYEHPELIERLKDKLSLDETQACALFMDTKRFLSLCATHPGDWQPPPAIDACWHEFMLYSKEYAEFCESKFGRFIHHVPDPYLTKNPALASRAAATRALAEKTFFHPLGSNWEYGEAPRVDTGEKEVSPSTRSPLSSPILAALYRWRIRAEKVALYSRDRLDLEQFTRHRPESLRFEEEPFRHIIIDNFFTPETYQALLARFEAVKQRGFLDTAWDQNFFHRFEIDYDGYVYIPPGSLDATNPFSVFFSLEWNWFFSKLFRQFTGFETSVALHYHPPGDRTGFVHHDDTEKRFSPVRRLANGVYYGEGPTSEPIVARRKIALLYFLGKEAWHEGDGGETGLYATDAKTLVKKVAPVSNRLLAFEISPRSYHAFQENHTGRSSIVQWFHVPPELA